MDDIRMSSIEDVRFKQVSDEKRKAICKKLPCFLFGFLITGGFMFWCRENEKDALSKFDDKDHSIRDSA